MTSFVTFSLPPMVAENPPNPTGERVSGTNRRIFLIAHSHKLTQLSEEAIEFYCCLCSHVRVVREPVKLPDDRRAEVDAGLWDGAIDELVAANLVEVQS